MSKSTRKSITTSVLVTTILFVISSFILSVFCIKNMSHKYQKSMADMAIEFSAAVINPDDAREFLATRNTDNRYTSVQDKLKQFQNENKDFVQRISLIDFSSSDGNYIYDTNGNTLGDRFEYNSYINSVESDLINCRNSWTTYQKDTLLVFRPLRTSEDESAGYIVAEIKEPFNDKYIIYTIILYTVILIAGISISVVFDAYIKKKLFIPIKKFTETAKNITSENNNFIKENPDAFEEDRDDEIGELGKEFKKMFLSVNSNIENLSKALYDANHDGMTQTLNKRCYQNMMPVFRECESICIIYFDVNNLKLMNDTLGHERGDMVIKRAAEYIQEITGQNDYCFRMGGDEFLMVMTNCSFRQIDNVIEKLESEAPFILNGNSDPMKCALSFGYSYAKGEYSYDELLTEAEENMYTKKAELKNLLNMPER
ncbi:MAG: diguanylate cyclase [Ruminococcus sp.]|nr:diguanylate cyclase [Ruminococcus sp.]